MFKALSPDPNERFATIKDFHEEMNECLSNPRAGQKQLSALFKNVDEEEAQEDDASKKSKILESLTNNIGLTILGRAFSFLACVPVAVTGVLNISFLGAMNPNL